MGLTECVICKHQAYDWVKVAYKVLVKGGGPDFYRTAILCKECAKSVVKRMRMVKDEGRGTDSSLIVEG